jgi:hypothetical protein
MGGIQRNGRNSERGDANRASVVNEMRDEKQSSKAEMCRERRCE